jgi:hypothetical protein
VVSETKQTFVATICIAARDFIDSPIYLKQVQFLSAAGDIRKIGDLWRRGEKQCVLRRRQSGMPFCCDASIRYAWLPTHRIGV